MCYACERSANCLAAANPETVVETFGFTHGVLTWLAPEQRANLEHAARCLCESHYENYERVVDALEKALEEEQEMSDAFVEWLQSGWKEQVRQKQPTECLGCLRQNRFLGRIRCEYLRELLGRMRRAEGEVTCPYKVEVGG